jgi:putative nucleotidyltransferase with HDIG domain
MNREELFEELQKRVKDEHLIKHMLATEAVMRALARKFGEDEEKWGIAGLLHDIDYEVTKKDPDKHSLIGAEWLEEIGLPEDIIYAVKVHNERHGLPRKSLMDKALFAADPLTGFITAVALVMPDKKLSTVKVKSLKKKFKDKSFAAGASREQIRTCETELNIPLNEFFELSLKAMQDIANVLGL